MATLSGTAGPNPSPDNKKRKADDTSLLSILSTAHGRKRRTERLIGKRDLQAALKHGVKEFAGSDPTTGRPRWKYTFADIVYITDETSTVEITCYPVNIFLEREQITKDMQTRHEHACQLISNDPSSWTSHTVLVIDQSGSMRTSDVQHSANRSEAVFNSLSLEFIAERLDIGDATDTDVVSVVLMSDTATIVLEERPTDWLLYNELLQLRHRSPRSHGHYGPALDAAEELLCRNARGQCALVLMFLSDGQPSDHMQPGIQFPSRKGGRSHTEVHIEFTQRKIAAIASRFGRRLAVSTIGFGGISQDFSVLCEMADMAEEYGCRGSFQKPDLAKAALGKAISWLSTSLTATKIEMTAIGGSCLRTVRDVRREVHGAADEEWISDKWYVYNKMHEAQMDGGLSHKCEWSIQVNEWVPKQFPETLRGVAMRKEIFGEGAERMVHKFRLVGQNGRFFGPCLVAKESRFVEDVETSDNIQFHQLFCEAQTKAQKLADVFNEQIQKLRNKVVTSLPIVQFLECSVYVVHDQQLGMIGCLVEKMLDPKKYQKWNNNAGYVYEAGKKVKWNDHSANACIMEEIKCIEEESDDAEEEEEELAPEVISPADIPQAFSHFTYRATNRKMLVCDLQGVFDKSASPPAFEFTDPVIHYASNKGRANVYGRTDKGKKGMHHFFSKHTSAMHFVSCYAWGKSRVCKLTTCNVTV